MFKIVVVGTIALLATAQEHPIFNQKMIDEIKSKTSLWEPHELHTNPLRHKSYDELKAMLGGFMKRNTEFFPKDTYDADLENYQAPNDFDSREEWPNCIHEIRDQGACGSCWAFGATEVMSDRVCIATDGKENEVFSPQMMVNCDTERNMGCQGGYLNSAWDYIVNHGVVTDACKPYISGETGEAGVCDRQCDDGTVEKPRKAKTYNNCFTIFDIFNQQEKCIKNEIQQHGPVETGFSVYEDFMTYRTGIYVHTTG